MIATTATHDDRIRGHDISYRIRNYQHGVSLDPAIRKLFYKGVFLDFVERGFTVLERTPLTEHFPRIRAYASAMKALPDAAKQALTPKYFNQQGYHPEDPMGVRSFMLFLQKQPEGLPEMVHAFRQDSDVDFDRYLPGFTGFSDITSALSIDITKIVFRGIAYGYGKDPGYFDRNFEKHVFSDKRCFVYPPTPEVMGCGDHDDFGLVTVAESNSSGLQLKMDDGRYVNVCPGPGRVVIWAGKALEIITGGHETKIKTVRHRVVIEESDRTRHSVIFFQGGSVTVPPSFIGDVSANPFLEEFPLYTDMSTALIAFGEWIRQTDIMDDDKFQFDEAFRQMVRGAA